MEKLFYLYGKNKDVDQLHGYSTADLHLCFVFPYMQCIYAKIRFSHNIAHLLSS